MYANKTNTPHIKQQFCLGYSNSGRQVVSKQYINIAYFNKVTVFFLNSNLYIHIFKLLIKSYVSNRCLKK